MLEIRERRHSAAEIVQRETATKAFELADKFLRLPEVGDRGRLGDFKTDRVVGNAQACERRSISSSGSLDSDFQFHSVVDGKGKTMSQCCTIANTMKAATSVNPVDSKGDSRGAIIRCTTLTATITDSVMEIAHR